MDSAMLLTEIADVNSSPSNTRSNDGNLVRLVLQVHFTANGVDELLFVVGGVPQLGNWNVNHALPLTPPHESQDQWIIELMLPAQDFDYVYLVKNMSTQISTHFSRRRLRLAGRVTPIVTIEDGIGLNSLKTSFANSTSVHRRSPISHSARHSVGVSGISVSKHDASRYQQYDIDTVARKLQQIEFQLSSTRTRLSVDSKHDGVTANRSGTSLHNDAKQFDDIRSSIAEIRQDFDMLIRGQHDTSNVPAIAETNYRHVDTVVTLNTHLQRIAKEIHALRHTTLSDLDTFSSIIDRCGQSMLPKLNLKSVEHIKTLEKLDEVQKENCDLHRRLEGLQGKIRVICRIKPLPVLKTIHTRVIDRVDANSLCVRSPGLRSGQHRMHVFDRVLGEETSSADMFSEISDLVDSVVDGYSLSVFAFGQTGSGKTHTMNALHRDCLDALFDRLCSASILDWNVKLSVLEIHNNALEDLLVPSSSVDVPLEISAPGMLPNSCLRVANLSEINVKNARQAKLEIERATANRQTHGTLCNDTSSRSHLLVALAIESTHRANNDRITARFCLIDLAGSERVKVSGVSGERLKESQFINKSLSTLGNVFRAIGEKNAHVPYRDSKLTYAMQDGLDGSARVVCILCICPSSVSENESVCSLRFGARLKNVALGVVQPRVESGAYMHFVTLSEKRLETIQTLQKRLDMLEESSQLSTPTHRTASSFRSPVSRIPAQSPITSSCSAAGAPRTPQSVSSRRRSSLTGRKTPAIHNRINPVVGVYGDMRR